MESGGKRVGYKPAKNVAVQLFTLENQRKDMEMLGTMSQQRTEMIDASAPKVQMSWLTE